MVFPGAMPAPSINPTFITDFSEFAQGRANETISEFIEDIQSFLNSSQVQRFLNRTYDEDDLWAFVENQTGVDTRLLQAAFSSPERPTCIGRESHNSKNRTFMAGNMNCDLT